MGKIVDMNALRTKNEKTRAVGNVKNLNARGDTIDAFGRVTKAVTNKVSDSYSKTVGNRSSNVTKKPQPRIQPDKPKLDLAELTPAEIELEESLDDDLEVEKIKAQETKKGKK